MLDHLRAARGKSGKPGRPRNTTPTSCSIPKADKNQSLTRSTSLAPAPAPLARNSAGRQLIADLSAQVRDIVSAESLINTLVEVHEGRRPIPRRMQHPLTGEVYVDESGDLPRAADRVAAARELKEWGWGKNPITLDMDKHVQVRVGVDVNRLSARDAKAFLELSRKARGEPARAPAAETPQLTDNKEADVVEGVFRDENAGDVGK
jgi:hypothetical protein